MSSAPIQVPVSRTLLGGVLMGLANLVPGVSGGTLVLAVGLYDRFVGAIARCTRLRPERGDLVFLGLLGGGAIAAVFALAGPAVFLVTHHRWAAYSVFIGLTLGGVPALGREVRRVGVAESAAFLLGLGVVSAAAFASEGSALPSDAWVLAIVGFVAASSMVLPGISGSYILVLCGLYEVVIGALRPTALSEDYLGSLAILAPFGVGVACGVALLSNAVRAALARSPQVTHAALLGLLVGSVLGLWPFQQPEHPLLVHDRGRAAVVDLVDGVALGIVNEHHGLTLSGAEASALAATFAGETPESLKDLARSYVRFRPSTASVLKALGLCLLGFFFTKRLSRKEECDGEEG
jgi:putative membrane protein